MHSRNLHADIMHQACHWRLMDCALAVLFPALLACRSAFYGKAPMAQRDWVLVGSLFQPAILLIDHGHFQYNSISLGLAVRLLSLWP